MACATKTLYAVLQEMVRRGGNIPQKKNYPGVDNNVELTDWEKAPAGKMQYIRWTKRRKKTELMLRIRDVIIARGTRAHRTTREPRNDARERHKEKPAQWMPANR